MSVLFPFPRHTSDVYELIREAARKFADAKIRPRAKELDESEVSALDHLGPHGKARCLCPAHPWFLSF